jgi:[ribosomal protein S5]-alanine N-acetyltransferase
MGECWIHTERLSLRPYQNEDLDQVLSFLGDSETMSFYPSPFSREKVIEMIERNIETWRKSSFGLMIVVEKGCEEIVGDCGITMQNIDGRDEHEVGYRFDRRVWGRG